MNSDRDIRVFAKTLRSHRRQCIRYHILTILIEISLYLLGLKRTRRILDLLLNTGSRPNISNAISIIDRSVTIFNQIKIRNSLKGKCLSQSLALQFILRRKGIDTTLIIGGYIKDGGLFAHAWLEKDGEVLNDHLSLTCQYKILLAEHNFSKFPFK